MKHTVRLWQVDPSIELLFYREDGEWSRERKDAWEISDHRVAAGIVEAHPRSFLVPVEEPRSSHTLAKENFTEIKHHPQGRDWLRKWQEEHE